MNNRVKGLLIAFLSMGASWAVAQNNTFPTTGNVGIGTTSPTKKLDVEGVVKGNEFGFPFVGYNFDLGPRTQLGPMSIKLFDDYDDSDCNNLSCMF